jgi:hypothetical protein
VIDDVGEECYGLLGADVHDGSSLGPLGELIECYEEMCEAPERLSERPHHVEVPHSKRPCDGYGLKCLCWEVSLSSVELVSLAAPHNVLGVRHCRGSVEILSESFSDKSPQTGVMSACAGVDFTK